MLKNMLIIITNIPNNHKNIFLDGREIHNFISCCSMSLIIILLWTANHSDLLRCERTDKLAEEET